MLAPKSVLQTVATLLGSALPGIAQAACNGPPVTFTGDTVELEAPITVKSGTGCAFGLTGIPRPSLT